MNAGLGKTDMVTILQRRRIGYAEPIVGPKAKEKRALEWIREQMQQLRHSIRDQGMNEWHQQRLTYLHRRWETEVAAQLAADCAQAMEFRTHTCLAWRNATELDRKPLGKRPQGCALWIQHKLQAIISVAAAALLECGPAARTEAGRLQGLARRPPEGELQESHRRGLDAIVELADAVIRGSVSPGSLATARCARDELDGDIKHSLALYAEDRRREWAQWAKDSLLGGMSKAHKHIKKGEG